MRFQTVQVTCSRGNTKTKEGTRFLSSSQQENDQGYGGF
jgi:hypothetical protein